MTTHWSQASIPDGLDEPNGIDDSTLLDECVHLLADICLADLPDRTPIYGEIAICRNRDEKNPGGLLALRRDSADIDGGDGERASGWWRERDGMPQCERRREVHLDSREGSGGSSYCSRRWDDRVEEGVGESWCQLDQHATAHLEHQVLLATAATRRA